MTPREIIEGDYPGVQALHRSVGWPERSLAGWRWLHSNPARLDIGAPAGWIVDGPDGEPAAPVGNLIQRFRLGWFASWVDALHERTYSMKLGLTRLPKAGSRDDG